MNTRAPATLLLVAPLLGFACLACSGGDADGSVVPGEVGKLDLAVQLSPGTKLGQARYEITGPRGFSKSGALDVRSSKTLSATIGGLPAGSGYSVTLTATATDGSTTCSGSATFDVVAGRVTSVTVHLSCGASSGSGSAALDGVTNVCPVIDGISALPAEIVTGNPAALTALAHDSDAAPAALSYRWSAPSGTLSSATSRTPSFTCTGTGTVPVTLTVSDGDSTPGCAATMDVTLTCSRDEVVTRPYPGITLVRRTDQLLSPARQVKMNLVFVDLDAPEVRFKMTPQGENLPPDLYGTAGWPTPYPEFEVVRRRTLDFLEEAHAQVAINSHFFAPFPVPAGSNQGDYAYLIGFAASRGNVYSGFESPFQNYAIVSNSPAINIDPDNNASVVHRDPAFADGKHVLEDVALFNALSGSAQIITDGTRTVPQYADATHPDALLTPNATYSNANSWYELVNARTAIGLTEDARTLVLFTVDVRPSSGANRSGGMRVSEVAAALQEYGVWNALALDGGGSTSMAMQDPADNVRKQLNVSSDSALGRAQASNLAVYSDGIPPETRAEISRHGAITVTLDASDLRNGISGELPGWVDQIRYSLSGAQTSSEQVVNGDTATLEVTTPGTSTISYFAIDAAGNREEPQTVTVRVE